MIFETESKTFSTIIALQLGGNSFFKSSVVKQKDALVLFAMCLYFFEWKKVKFFSVEEKRSFISVIVLSLSKLSISCLGLGAGFGVVVI